VKPRYGIAEWYGHPFLSVAPRERRELARTALKETGANPVPPCPFQRSIRRCGKPGGVCALQHYEAGADGRIAAPRGTPVAVCPNRFEQDRMLISWLAEIVGFPADGLSAAREVPFMKSPTTEKPAGLIDIVVARDAAGALRWYGLEIQAVYFSGKGMASMFRALRDDFHGMPPFPDSVRRPDWRSSSAKRLMPQLQIKGPTLRRWASKVAVAVDRPFFDSLGGVSPSPTQDLDAGDVIWMVPELVREADGSIRLHRYHWEVLTLEDSDRKLLAADTISRADFEKTLRAKLVPVTI